MNRFLIFFVATAFGLVLALALIVGHPSSASASPSPSEPAVGPVGGDQTTGVDHWMLDPTPVPPPSAAAVPAATVTPSAPPATAVTPVVEASTAAVATTAATAPVAAATPRANLIGPATTAPAVPASAPAPAAAPPADVPVDPAAPVDPAPSVAPLPAPDVAVAVAYAIDQVGLPYRYAGDGPNAFDCSGLTLAAYREIGIALPHRSESQVNMGRGVDWQSEGILPGDLIVTAGGNGRHYAGHVGLAVSATEWVVAPATGQHVTQETMPFDRIQSVRRLVGPAG